MAERRSARLTPTNQSGTLTATTQKAQKVTTGPQQTTIPTQKTTSVAQRLDCSTPQPEAPTTVPVPNFVNRAPDVSNLRRPIQLGVEGVPQILRCMQSATKEITDVLLYECNIIYECKVCLSLFRGLTNLIAHKRAYCEDCHHDNKLDFVNNKPEDETIVVQPVAPPPVTNEWDNYIDSDVESTSSVLGIGENTGQSTVQSVTPQGIQDSLTGRSHAFRFYNAVVERAQKKAQERNLTTLTLSPIKSSSVAVYQDTGSRTRKDDEISTAGSDKGSLDSQKENVIKPSKPLPVKTKVKDIVKTEPAGKKKNLESTSSTIFKLNRFKQVDIQHLMCLKCAKKLSSRRSLLRHMMSLHAIKKVYYLCPLCKKRMTRVDNVVKHLKTHHDKTDEEAMKFRSQVTSKKNSIVVANKLNDSILQTDSDEDASGNSETSGDKKGNFSLNSCEDCGNVFSKAELLQRHCATECKMSNKSKKSSKSMNSSSNKVVKGSKSASIKSTSKSAGVQSSSKSAGVQSTSKQSKGNAGKTSMDKKSKVSIKTEKTIKSNVSIKSESDKSTTKSQPKTTAKSQSEKTTAKSQTEKTTAKSQSENKSGHKSQTATENKTNNKSKTASKVQTDNKANKPATTKSRERSISGIEKWLNKSLDSTSNVTEKDTKSPASSVKSGSAPGTKSASSTAGNKSISTANKQKTTTQVIIDDKQTPKDGAVEGTKSSVKVTAEKCPKYLPGGAGGQDISGSRSDSEKTPRKESDKGARRDSVENVFEKFQKTVSSSPSTENPSSNPQSLDPQTKGKTHGNTESKTQAEQARSKAKDEESVKPKKSASPRGQTALLARDKPNKAGSPLGPEGRDPSPVRTKHSRSHSQGHVTEVKAIKSQESIKGRLSLPAVQMKSQRLRSLVKAKAASCTDETTEVKTESDGTILGKRKRKDELEQRSKVDADPDEISTSKNCDGPSPHDKKRRILRTVTQ